MSMLLVHELHEARDRILLLIQRLQVARKDELPAYLQFVDEQVQTLEEALRQAQIPDRYRVAIVGRFKVGKSSFVNKLAGQLLAGVDTSPETAAISVFRYDAQTRAEVEFISREEWNRLAELHAENPKDAEVKRYDHFMNFNDRAARKGKEGADGPRSKADLQGLLAEWVTQGGKRCAVSADKWDTKESKRRFRSDIRKFTSSQEPLHYLVNQVTIYAPIPILRDQIELIDTPGLDDTEHFRVRLTEELVKDVDAILFLTESGASYSQSDKDFILRQLRLKQIKHFQLIVTKCDATFENACRDAKENDDTLPSYEQFCISERSRVKTEAKATLDELLQSNQLTDDQGYYFIQQLDNVPVHLISTTYHEEGNVEKGGIDGVRDGLYQILSTSYRFEHAKSILVERLNAVLHRLERSYRERLTTLEGEFDPQKVKDEIESIRKVLDHRLDDFGERVGESLRLLSSDQEAFFHILPTHLDVVELRAKEVLTDLERDDLIKHWKRRRYGRWGYLQDLQAKIADRIFPKVEAVLNDLRTHLGTFMKNADQKLIQLQEDSAAIESEHRLTGLEALELSSAQAPLFTSLNQTFEEVGKQERDGIVTKLDDFVTAEVQERLDAVRESVANVFGTGTTYRQAAEVRRFYDEIRRLLGEALRQHLEFRIHEFAAAIMKQAASVGPRVREASEELIRQRLKAIRSTLQLETEGRKEQVRIYLSEMLQLVSNFAAEPAASAVPISLSKGIAAGGKTETLMVETPADETLLREQHYEISDGSTGYTYERIFRPYIDDASEIRVEDAYIRLPHQIDNFCRFCALAVRLGELKRIELISAADFGENTDDADSRLETLKRDLEGRGIKFSYKRESNLHDREIRFNNGWIVRIGRGLDIYYKPESWISTEAVDFSLRRCKRTKVDVFRG